MMTQRNSRYWQQRMATVANFELNKGAEYNARIEKQYNAAIEQIESEISKWYARYAGENGITYAEAQKMLSGKELQKFRMSIEEFTAKAKSGNPQWQKQLDDAYARVRISRLESMKMQLQNIAESVSMDVEKGFPDVANAIYTDSYYRTAYEVQRGTGVGYSFARVDETKAEKLLQSPWAADGKDFSDRVWANKNQLISELQGTFTRHVIAGTDPSKTIAELSERMNVSKTKAGRLVMTESAYFASAATKDSFNALGVTQYQIVATLDSHTSAICQTMDGKVLPMKEYKEGATAPPFHVNCRSTTVPYFDDEFTEDETRAARDENDKGYERVPADITYPEWQERFVQKEIIDTENDTNQYYKPISLSEENEQFVRGQYEIRTRKLINSEYDINVSENVKLTARQAAFVQKNIRDALTMLNVGNADNLPNIYIVSNVEMQKAAVAAYNPMTNKLFLCENALSRKSILNMQKDMANPKNPLSTYYHELLHWKDAQLYMSKHGTIDTKEKYFDYIKDLRMRCKKYLANLEEQGYNIHDISNYASDAMGKRKFDEVYTEYRVKENLRG